MIVVYLFKFWCVDIRLTNGTDATEGIIEINEDGRWGVLCNNSFTDAAATVVCRQLRFGLPILYYGNAMVDSGAYYAYDHYYYYDNHYTPCEDAQRFSHCFSYYYYNYGGRCYDTFLKCSSM